MDLVFVLEPVRIWMRELEMEDDLYGTRTWTHDQRLRFSITG